MPCERVELLEERVLWVLAHAEEGAAIARRAHEAFRTLATPERVQRALADDVEDLELVHRSTMRTSDASAPTRVRPPRRRV